MGVLSLLLLGVLWTTWKGGAIKELGLLALAFGALGQLIGLYDAFSVMEANDVPSHMLAGGLKVSLTPTLYGLLIYVLSLLGRLRNVSRKQIL